MLPEHHSGSPAARIVGNDHQFEDHEDPRITPRSQHQHDKRSQERHVHGGERRRNDIAHARRTAPIEQSPRRTDEHGDIQGEKHTLAAQPPGTRHHTDRAHVQRSHSQGDAHARERTRQLPNADQADKTDHPDERRKRRKQGDRNGGDQDNSRCDRLRKITPGLPRRPTRGMIVACGARGENASKQ